MRKLPWLLAFTLIAAACAGGSSTTTAAPTGPIKLGLLTSLTGNYAPLGTNDKLAAVQMVNAINAKGGINGRNVELEILDDGSDPSQTVVQLTKLVDDGNIAFEGPSQSTAELAIQSLVNEKKIPDVSVGAADKQVIPVTPYMWQTTPLASQVAAACMKFLQQQGKTRLAMLTDVKNAYAIAGHDVAVQKMSQYGLTLVTDQQFETSNTNFAPQIANIQNAKPDFLLVWATGAPPVVITKQWAAANTGIPLMMTAAEGVYVEVSLAVTGQSLPPANRFKKAIDGFAGPFQQANNYYPPQFAWDSMIAMSFLFDAIKRRGATSEGIRAGLDSINLDTPNGHYTFTPQKHYGQPDSSSFMSQVKNAQFIPVGITQDQLAKAGQ